MKARILEFTISGDCYGYWYVYVDGGHLHKDLEIHHGTGYWDANCIVSDAPGYYESKAEAERYLKAYEVKHMKFIVRQCRHWPERGWYIITDTGAGYRKEQFVWKDLELHNTTGYGAINQNEIGFARGYYHDRYQAEAVLELFKEKHSMKDNFEINVKLNGVDTPLHEISEQTLLRIREASKPKPVPVFQVCRWKQFGSPSRFILKVTPEMIAGREQYIVLNGDGCVVASYRNMEGVDCDYQNRRELKLEEL